MAQVGTVVALADKLETLVGMFGIGQIPTGDRDPFALRRHALGTIRMLAEGHLDLPLNTLLTVASQAFAAVDGFQPAETVRVTESSSLAKAGFTGFSRASRSESY